MMSKRVWWIYAAVLLSFVLPAQAQAQGRGQVVALMTEVVEAGILGDQPRVTFWWSEAGQPRWTPSDEAFNAALQARGVSLATSPQQSISRIYRRPALSTANAAQLGALLGGERVLVGQVTYRAMGPVWPLGVEGIEASAELELVAAGSVEGVSLQRFTVTRHYYGEDLGALLESARQEVGGALGDVAGRGLRRVAGPVGIATAEPLLAVRNAGKAGHLERVRERLLELDEVHAVVERWASEGIIALEINPGELTSPDVIEYAVRVLEGHSFDNFSISPVAGSRMEGVHELWIEPYEQGF
ncbi:hypothetical protein FRC98_09315 [Lujinxingia vulgaris]|uniref:Uncharacterized protein n=1 Tax=Lujinxingia vulgaris TaxID=2600176 RepID=A0A5C6XKM8_9DELT|nr:hypothetical protein [Lujinxingia vulgaris]TXD37866.1 hypothetical protein FRC98_09315 [Lujinxingia vulgaris]